MFVNASAIVAILTGEPEADALADELDAALSPITSAIAIFEAVLGLSRKRYASVAEARTDVMEFLGIARVRTVAITATEAEAALDAFDRYGKGRGHPAQLNLGECFAYAVAKTNQTAILFKGDDFNKTDIHYQNDPVTPPRR
jgi:ribonuclease VapC